MSNQLLACFHPTTTVFVDDRQSFLDIIDFQVKTNGPKRLFKDPIEATDYLKKNIKNNSFINRYASLDEDRRTGHNILEIHEEIYRAERLEEVPVIVLDYDMPGMTGAEISKELYGSHYKIILLTGEATDSHAIKLFNDGYIHHFIKKDQDNFFDELNATIAQFQNDYFSKPSQIIIDEVSSWLETYHKSPSCFDDPVFIEFFNAFLEKHKPAEYYMLDEFGSYLFLTENAELDWLIVQYKEHMDDLDDEVELCGISDKLLPLIKNRELLNHYFAPYDTNFNDKEDSDWMDFLYPCNKLNGKQTYYYSHIKKPKTDISMDTNKIISFQKYLEKK